MGRLSIGTHLDQSNYLAGPQQQLLGFAVPFTQCQQTVENFWAKPAHFDFFSSKFYLLSTGRIALVGFWTLFLCFFFGVLPLFSWHPQFDFIWLAQSSPPLSPTWVNQYFNIIYTFLISGVNFFCKRGIFKLSELFLWWGKSKRLIAIFF